MSKEEEIQKMALQWSGLQADLQALSQKREGVLIQLYELETTKKALDDLEKITPGKDALIQIGFGNFIEGNITNTDNVVVSIGAGVALKKSRKEALDIIEKRIASMKEIAEQIAHEIEEIGNSMFALQQKIEHMQQSV